MLVEVQQFRPSILGFVFLFLLYNAIYSGIVIDQMRITNNNCRFHSGTTLASSLLVRLKLNYMISYSRRNGFQQKLPLGSPEFKIHNEITDHRYFTDHQTAEPDNRRWGSASFSLRHRYSLWCLEGRPTAVHHLHMAGTGESDVPKPSLVVLRQFNLGKTYLCKSAALLTILFTLKSSDDIQTFTFFMMKFITNVWKMYLSQTPTHLTLLSLLSLLPYAVTMWLIARDYMHSLCTSQIVTSCDNDWTLSTSTQSKTKNLNRPLSILLSYMQKSCKNFRGL